MKYFIALLVAATIWLVNPALAEQITSYAPSVTTSRVSTSQLDKTDATFALVPGLSIDISANASYVCRVHLSGTSGATGGYRVGLIGTNGLSSVTSYSATTDVWNGTVAVGRATITAWSTTNNSSAAVFTDIYIVTGFVTTVGGTLNVNFSQTVINATPSSVFINSTFDCTRVS